MSPDVDDSSMPPKLVVPVRSLFPAVNSSPEHSSKGIDLIRAAFLQDSKSDARASPLSADIVNIEIFTTFSSATLYFL